MTFPDFLKCFCSWSQSVCVSPSPRLSLTTHVKWNCISQLNKCYNFPVIMALTFEWMGLALATKHIISACQGRQRWCFISCSVHKRTWFNSKVQQSVSVIKVSRHTHSEGSKRDLGFELHSKKYNFVLLLKVLYL